MLAAPVFVPAHCPTSVPDVKMEYPAAGVAVQEACYKDFGGCYVDTFHLDTLRRQLAEKFAANRYAVFAYVDSVRHYQTFDTLYYRGQIYYIDTFQTEDVHVGIHTYLKDSLPTRHLSFRERWLGFVSTPLATTFLPLMDTPFVAFFNEYDSIKKLGIGPMDGCFFEPTGHFVYDGRIHKKGQPGERMPGISLPMEDFFADLGLDPVPLPSVSILRPARRPRKARPPGIGRSDVFDANGRRIPAGNRPPEIFYLWDARAGRSSGADLLRDGAKASE